MLVLQPDAFLASCAQQMLVLLEPCFASGQAVVVDLLGDIMARLHSMFPIARGESSMPKEALVRPSRVWTSHVSANVRCGCVCVCVCPCMCVRVRACEGASASLPSHT